jgi:hypothetical protein
MNARMYDAASHLDRAALAADRGAVSGSISGMLNRTAVADTTGCAVSRCRTGLRRAAGAGGVPDVGIARAAAGRSPGRPVPLPGWAGRADPAPVGGADTRPPGLRQMAGQGQVGNSGAAAALLPPPGHHRGQAPTLPFQAGVEVGVTGPPAPIHGDPARAAD